MGGTSNPPGAITPKAPSTKDGTAPFGPDVEAVKIHMDETLKRLKPLPLKPLELPEPKALISIKIENDDLVYPMNKGKDLPHDFTDGSILTSQLSINASAPVKKGFLKDGSITGEISATTSTSWGNIEQKDYSHDPEKLNGIKTDKPIIDGSQIPTSEKYSLTVGAVKPLKINDTHQLDIGVRADASYVSSKPVIQNMWHDKLNNAPYLLSQTNTAKSQLLLNTEVTGAYHTTKDTPRMHKDITLLGGTSLGNGYQGVMGGIDVSVGSPSSRYFPQMSHSAQLGNTNPDHIVQGDSPQSGAWKLSAYAKVYASTNHDYRTTMSAMASAPETGTRIFNSAILTDKPIIKNVTDHDQTVQVNAFETITQTNTINYSIPDPVSRYDFKPINVAGGLRAQVQIGSSVNVGAQIGYITNPSKPVLNPGHQAEIDKIANFYANQPFVNEFLTSTNPAQLRQDQEYVNPVGAADYATYATHKKNPALSPLGNFTGEVSINITLGGGKKNTGRTH